MWLACPYVSYVTVLVLSTAFMHLVSSRFIVEVCLAFILLAMVGTAVTGLRSPSNGRTLLHSSRDILPVKRLNTVTGALESANVGTEALVFSLVLSCWWAVVETLTASPSHSSILSTLVFGVGYVSLITFMQHKSHVPLQQ